MDTAVKSNICWGHGFFLPRRHCKQLKALTGGFLKSDSRIFMEEDVFAVFARSCWERVLRVYRCSKGLQKRWRREEREDGESQKERVNTETHSRLVSHLFTVYKDISAWQGAMPNNGIHQSWASSKPSEIHPPPSPPLAYKNGHGIPAKVTCKAFKLAIPSHTLPHHLKWLRCS